MTSCNLENYPDLMNKFCPDGTGKALGSLKNELLDLIPDMKLINTKCFDSLILGGLKFYSLKKVLNNGDVKEINKLKGDKIKWDDRNGKTHIIDHNTFETQTCMKPVVSQFKCGVQGYMDESNPNLISVLKVDKKFNIQYSKASPIEHSYMLKPLVV